MNFFKNFMSQESNLIFDYEVEYLNNEVTEFYFQSKISFISKNSVFVAYEKKYSATANRKTQRYAIKPLCYETEEEIENVNNEIDIIQLFNDNPNFIKYLKWFDLKFRHQNYKFIVMNYYDNLDLFDLCCKNNVFVGLPELDSCYVVYQILKILKSMKDLQIVHHDIKLENFLVVSKSPIKLLITDFEFAELMTEGTSSKYIGTPYIRAPEVLKEDPHDTAADIWSLGILLYQLLYKKTPFYLNPNCDDPLELLDDILSTELSNPGTASLNAWECVSQMLVIEPENRISVENALKLDWFYDINDDSIDTKAQISAISQQTGSANKVSKTDVKD